MNSEELKKLLSNKEDLPIVITLLAVENEYLKKTLIDKEKEIERLIKLSE